jgi:hypothetical protein
MAKAIPTPHCAKVFCARKTLRVFLIGRKKPSVTAGTLCENCTIFLEVFKKSLTKNKNAKNILGGLSYKNFSMEVLNMLAATLTPQRSFLMKRFCFFSVLFFLTCIYSITAQDSHDQNVSVEENDPVIAQNIENIDFLQYYNSEMFSWQYDMWIERFFVYYNLGYSLKYHSYTSDIAFGIPDVMKNALLEFPDSGEAFYSYRRKNIAGNTLIIGGYALVLGGFIPMMVASINNSPNDSNINSTLTACSVVMGSGVLSNLIGMFVHASGKESLFRAVSLFNRNKMDELNGGNVSLPVGQRGASARNGANQRNSPRQSRDQDSVPQLGDPTILQQGLNLLPAVPIAGKNLKFEFGGDNWIAKVNGGNFLAGNCTFDETDNGYIITLKTTHVWTGAVEEVIDLLQKVGVPLGPAAGPLRTAARVASRIAKWIPLKESSIILEYNEGLARSLHLGSS